VESEGESTTSSTSYQTKVKLVSDATGYHLIILSWEIGNTSTSYFAQARVTLNGSVNSEFSEEMWGASAYYRTYATHFIANLAVNDSIKIEYRTSDAGGTTRIKRARIVAIPLESGNYDYVQTLNVLNLPTTWTNVASLNIQPATPGDYLIIGSLELRPDSTNTNGEARMNLDGSTWDSTSVVGENNLDRVAFFSARIVNLNTDQHTIRIQARSDAGSATDLYHPRISVIRLTDVFGDFSQAENLGEASTTNVNDNWVNRVDHRYTPPVAGNYLVMGSSLLKTIASTSVIPEHRWTLDGVEQNKFITPVADNTDYLPHVGLRKFNWDTSEKTLQLDYTKNSNGTETVYIKFARILTLSEAPPNHAPELDSIGPKTVMEGDTLEFRIHATDIDGDSIILDTLNVPLNAAFVDSGNGAGSFVFTPDFTQAGTFYVTLIASDGSLTDSEVVEITVTEFGNHAPELDSIGPQAVVEGDTLEFRIHATDIDADSIILDTLNVPVNATFVDSGNGSGSFIFTSDFTQSGVFYVTFIASDGSLTDSEVVEITVSEYGNHAPELDSIGPQAVVEGDTLEFRIHATDIDGDSIILDTLNVPLNAVFVDSGNGAGSFVFTPDFTQAGTFYVTLIASDGSLADSEVVEITVSEFGNHAPELDSIGPQAVVEGDTLGFRIHATDIDADSIILDTLNVPVNAVFVDSGNGSGSFVFTPDFTQSGIFYVTFIASDGSLTDSEVVEITVSEFGNHAPELDSIGPKTVMEGDTLEFRIHATDIDADSIILDTLNVPVNATFVDSGNGSGSFIFTSDFTQSGVFYVTFIASDGSLTDSEVVEITVSEYGNHAPELDSIGPQAVVEGDTLEFRIHATDIDGDSIILDTLNVPLNAVFVDSGNGAGSFVFTPDFTQAGTFYVTFIASDGSLTDSEVVEITVTEFGNHAPELDSIGPKTVMEGDILEFRIHATDIDADSIILSTLYTPLNAVFVDSGNGSGSFTFTPNFTQSGIYNVTFIANDTLGGADSEGVQITVVNVNRAPELDSVGAKSVSEGDILEFRIHASDPDLDSIILDTLNVPANAVFVDSGNGAGSFIFTPDFTQSGVYNVAFIAMDTLGGADSEVVEITVGNVNRAPELDSVGAKSVSEGDILEFRIHASDPDLDSVILDTLNVPLNAVFVDSGNGAGSFIFTPDFTQSGVYNVTFIATDTLGGVDSEVVEITVVNVNRAPELDSVGAKSVSEGDILEFRIHASDPDLDSIILDTLNVPANAVFVDSGNGAGSFSFSPDYDQAGTYYVTFIASDGDLADSEVVSITVNHVNREPVLASIGPRSVLEGGHIGFLVTASDPDGDSLILSAENRPVNSTFTDSGNGKGIFEFDPDYTQSGPYYVTFIASDADLADSEVVQITVIEAGNQAPVLDSIGPKTVAEAETLQFRFHATDPDGDIPALFIRNNPANSTYSDSGNGAGTFTFAPNYNQAGTYFVTFAATDGALTDSEVVEITVTNTNRPPELDSIGAKTLVEGDTLEFRIHASDPDLDSIILDTLNVPLNAVFVDSGNGVGSFVFTPDFTQSGIYNVTFIASDTLGGADSEVVQITVSEFGNHAPELDSIGPQAVLEEDTLEFRIHATDADGDSIFLDTLNVPLNATFVDSGNGAGSFFFTPDFTQSGMFYVTFIASDGSLADSEVVEITVGNVNRAPELDSVGAKSVSEGDTLEFRIHASDPDLDSIILNTLNVPLNAAFVDSGNGAGSFTFTPDFTQAGVYDVTFIASDGVLADSEVVEITVTEFGNHAPELDSIGPQAVVEGDTLEFRIHATDIDADSIILDTLNVPANAVFVDSGNGAGSFFFTSDFTQSGVFYVTFIASDGSLTDSEVVEITVSEFGNHAPELDSIGPQAVVEGDTLEFRIHATDIDGDSIILDTLNVPVNAAFVDSGNGAGSFVFTPDFTQAGTFYVTFIASDGSLTDSEVVEITVTEFGNHAPELDSIGPQAVVEGDTLEFRIHATDIDGDSIILDTLNVPANAVFVDSGNGAGSFIFTPDFTQSGMFYVTFIASDGSLTDSEVVEITVSEFGNHAPELDSIGPKTVVEGDTLEFRIHATDADGDSIILDTLNVPLNTTFVDSGNGAGSFIFTPDFTQSGVFYVTFVASDGSLADSEVVRITVVEFGNNAPELDSIGPQAVIEGDILEFRIHATDIDGDSIILDTLNVPANAVFVDSGNGAGSFVFTPDFTQAGMFYVTFIASDGSLTDSEVVEITVTEYGNHAPELDSIGPQAVVEGNTLGFRIHATDADGDSIILDTLNVPVNAAFVDSGNGAGSLIFTPDFTQSGVFYVTFIASDGSLTDSEVVEITVSEFGNHAPELDSIGPQAVVEGDILEFRIHATDIDGDSIILDTLNIPLNAVFVDSGNGAGSFVFTPDFTQAGTFYVTFIASDGSLTDSEVVEITVSEFGNNAPELDSIGPKTVMEGNTLEFRIHATDIDGDSIILDTLNVPANAVFVDSGNGAGSFFFTPDFTQSGVFYVTFIASDGSLTDSEVVEITVSEFGNNAPELDSIGPKTVMEGDTLEFWIHATDIDADSIILDTLNVPLNAVFVDSGNGAGSFIFTPDFTQSGMFYVTFIASDGSLTDSEVVEITVSEFGNNAPELDSIGPRTVTEGNTLEFRIHATDIDADSIILDTLNVPVNAAFVDSGNGAGSFVFTPDFTQAGTFYVTFIASDGSLTDSEVVEITVSEYGNHAPELDSIGPQAVVEGDILEFRIHATDIDGDSIILDTLNVPVNATFVDSGNGSGSFIFTPDFTQSGTFYVTFIASDGSLTDSEVVEITVSEYGNHAPELDSIGPQAVVEGDILEFRIHATDIDGDSIILDTLNVPLNAVFVDSGNGAGSFFFTPDFTQSGVYSVTFIASDGSLTDSEVVEITVSEYGNNAPELDSIGPQAVVEGDTLEFRIHATDLDGDSITLDTFNVPLNAVFVDSGNGAGSFVFTPDFTQSGIFYVTFIASDGSLTDSEVVEITVSEFGNHAPELDSIGPKTVVEGDTLEFRIHATDIDGDSLILDTLNVPLNAVFVDSGNGAGSFTFAPDTGQAGTYYVTFIASDTLLADSEVVEITVTEWANRPPVLDSIGPKTVFEGDSLIFTVAASDPDGTIPMLTATNRPDNATFVDSGNGRGLFKFYPDFYQAGVETVTFTAIDVSSTPPLVDLEEVVITIVDINQSPQIDSIGPKTVQAGETLEIRVVGSDPTDPDGGPLYLSVVGLPENATFYDSGGGIGGFIFIPEYSQAGVDTVTFYCTDEGIPPLSGYEVVEITVTEGANRPPTLDPIGYKVVTEGDTLEFRVHATDPDGTTPVLYTSEPRPTNATFVDSGNGAGSFLFTPDYTQSAIYEITFYASDGDLIDYEQVLIQVVEAGNQAPVLDSIGPQSVMEGDTLIFMVNAADPDSTIPVLTTDSLPIGAFFTDSANGTGLFEFYPAYVQSGIYYLTFMASDGELNDSEVVEITVAEAGNQPPVLDSIGPKSVIEREWLTFMVTASDPDSTTPIMRASDLPPSATFTDNGDGTGAFIYRPTYYEQGVYYALFEAIDSVDTLLRGWELVEITVIDSNQHPDVEIQPDSSYFKVDEGGTCMFKVIGTDPDSTFPSLHVVPLPDNATFTDSGNGVGVFIFTPDYSQGGYPAPTLYTVTAFVVDEVYPDTVWDAPRGIQVYDVPEPPNIVPINDTSIVEGDTLDIHVITTSIADIPSLQAMDLPTNSSFEDSSNGRGWFRFSPDFIQGDSTYDVRFVAESRGLADTEFVHITVIESGNHAPVLDSIGPKTIGEEQVLSFRIHATDVDGDSIVLDTLNVPQNAVFVDSGNGAGSFVFHPDWTQAGVYYVTFFAKDTQGAIDSEVVEITVANVDQPPVLDSIGLKTVAEGEMLQFRVHATDVDSDSLVFTAGPLPSHATFVDSGNGAGSFTFTPDYYQAGVHTVFFSVTDLVSSDYEAVPITITNVPQAPDLDSIGPQSVMEGDTLEFRIFATDSDGDPFTFSVENDPPNSSLMDSGNGVGSFWFAPTYTQAGQYLVTFKATDTTGAVDSEVVEITVTEAGNQPPVLVSLPDSVEPEVGDTFSLHVYATDPDGPSISLSAVGSPSNSDFVDSGNGGGAFIFAPDSTQEDSIYQVTFIASDGSLADSQLVILHVISYIPGDVNGDGEVDLGDVLYLISYLYKGGPAPQPMAAGDVNCDGTIDLGDVLYLTSYLYRGGPPPGCP